MARAIPDHGREPARRARGRRAGGLALPAEATSLARGLRRAPLTEFARVFLLSLVVPLAPAAIAPSARAAEPAPAWTPPPLPPCTCRAEGRVFDMGEEACLATLEGPRMAICAMDQNVTSWKPTARTCPSARRGNPAGQVSSTT